MTKREFDKTVKDMIMAVDEAKVVDIDYIRLENRIVGAKIMAVWEHQPYKYLAQVNGTTVEVAFRGSWR